MEHGCTAKPSDVEKAVMAAFEAAKFRVTDFKARKDRYDGGTGEYIVNFEMDDPNGLSLAAEVPNGLGSRLTRRTFTPQARPLSRTWRPRSHQGLSVPMIILFSMCKF